jgi:hypothetical protein
MPPERAQPGICETEKLLYGAEKRLPGYALADARRAGDGFLQGQRMDNSVLRHSEDLFFYTECNLSFAV